MLNNMLYFNMFQEYKKDKIAITFTSIIYLKSLAVELAAIKRPYRANDSMKRFKGTYQHKNKLRPYICKCILYAIISTYLKFHWKFRFRVICTENQKNSFCIFVAVNFTCNLTMEYLK